MQMPFDRWLKRIMHRTVHASTVDAVLCMVGEPRCRAYAAAEQSDRVRRVVRSVERAKESCKRAVGQRLRFDTGELTGTGGRVLVCGKVVRAVPVIVEEEVMHLRSLAYEVELDTVTGRKYTVVIDKLCTFEGGAA